jgi:hypothetical protein
MGREGFADGDRPLAWREGRAESLVARDPSVSLVPGRLNDYVMVLQRLVVS